MDPLCHEVRLTADLALALGELGSVVQLGLARQGRLQCRLKQQKWVR